MEPTGGSPRGSSTLRGARRAGRTSRPGSCCERHPGEGRQAPTRAAARRRRGGGARRPGTPCCESSACDLAPLGPPFLRLDAALGVADGPLRGRFAHSLDAVHLVALEASDPTARPGGTPRPWSCGPPRARSERCARRAASRGREARSTGGAGARGHALRASRRSAEATPRGHEWVREPQPPRPSLVTSPPSKDAARPAAARQVQGTRQRKFRAIRRRRRIGLQRASRARPRDRDGLPCVAEPRMHREDCRRYGSQDVDTRRTQASETRVGRGARRAVEPHPSLLARRAGIRSRPRTRRSLGSLSYRTRAASMRPPALRASASRNRRHPRGLGDSRPWAITGGGNPVSGRSRRAEVVAQSSARRGVRDRTVPAQFLATRRHERRRRASLSPSPPAVDPQ